MNSEALEQRCIEAAAREVGSPEEWDAISERARQQCRDHVRRYVTSVIPLVRDSVLAEVEQTVDALLQRLIDSMRREHRPADETCLHVEGIELAQDRLRVWFDDQRQIALRTSAGGDSSG